MGSGAQRNEAVSLGKFRNAMKQWKPTSSPCRLCKRYIHRIGFLLQKFF